MTKLEKLIIESLIVYFSKIMKNSIRQLIDEDQGELT